jgi:hypothetical protein
MKNTAFMCDAADYDISECRLRPVDARNVYDSVSTIRYVFEGAKSKGEVHVCHACSAGTSIRV